MTELKGFERRWAKRGRFPTRDRRTRSASGWFSIGERSCGRQQWACLNSGWQILRLLSLFSKSATGTGICVTTW